MSEIDLAPVEEAAKELLHSALVVIRDANPDGEVVPVTAKPSAQLTAEGRFAPAVATRPELTSLYIFCNKRLEELPAIATIRTALTDAHLDEAFLLDAGGNPVSPNRQASWLVQTCLGPLLFNYIERSETLAVQDDLVDETVAELMAYASGGGWLLCYLVPLPGFRATGEEIVFSDADMSIRPLELSEVCRIVESSSSPFAFSPGLGGMDLHYMSHCVAVTMKRGFSESFSTADADLRVQNVLLALRLLKPEPVRAPTAYAWPESLFGATSGFMTTGPGERGFLGDHYQLGQEDEPELKALYDSVRQIPEQKDLKLALRRFTYGRARTRDEDKLLDFWIALEALLLPNVKDELRYRASLRSAFLLGQTQGERQALFRKTKDSYDARSDVVHGGTVDDLASVTTDTEEILRKALRHFIAHPDSLDSEYLDSLILQAG